MRVRLPPTFDATAIHEQSAVAEKMIRKLRLGMMPPAGAKRPEAGVLIAFAEALETRLDGAAALNPNPGWRPFQRLNRAEYARAIHDLLAIDVDVSAVLPADTISDGFDNIADAQTFSPTLLAPIDHTLADTPIGVAFGITTLPHIKDLSIVGPHKTTGISDTASRRKVFTCRPTSPAEETPCAREIVRALATQAFRGPVAESDVGGLMRFYDEGRTERGFEAGVRAAIEAVLASPQFRSAPRTSAKVVRLNGAAPSGPWQGAQ